jgi:hypothetical protein
VNTIIAVLIPIASIGIGCFLFYIVWKSYVSTRNMSNWQITQGTIRKSAVKQAGAAFLPDVEYQYSVLGVEYKGSSVTIPPEVIFDVEVAQGLLEEYPVGKRVDVLYNPEIHRVAVLEKKAAVGNWWVLVMVTATGLTFLTFGFAYLLPLFQ